jgi:hypothetical protein
MPTVDSWNQTLVSMHTVLMQGEITIGTAVFNAQQKGCGSRERTDLHIRRVAAVFNDQQKGCGSRERTDLHKRRVAAAFWKESRVLDFSVEGRQQSALEMQLEGPSKHHQTWSRQ